jgi:hypothetical protein
MADAKARHYIGHRAPGQAGPGTVMRTFADGKADDLPLCRDLVDHSPDGFQWGYAGSGPAQLAFALVYDATGDERLTRQVYQDFKREIVVTLPDQWRLEAENIAEFARTLAHAPPIV